MLKYTDEQVERANNVDLVQMLESEGEVLKKVGHEYRWDRHNSVMINGNKWYRHSAEKGGLAIDFLKEFYSLSFLESVDKLLGGEQKAELKQASLTPKTEDKVLKAPPKNSDMHRVFAYLMKQRCIDKDVITHFAKAETLYEDSKYHNAIFVGKDENGEIKHIHKKGTLSYGKSFRGDEFGSDKSYTFNHTGTSNRLFVFEAPIDMLSYISLNKENNPHGENWTNDSYITLSGLSSKALLKFLENNPNTNEIYLCLDNDQAGIEAINRFKELLPDLAVYENLPTLKDWNEDLQQSETQDFEMSM